MKVDSHHTCIKPPITKINAFNVTINVQFYFLAYASRRKFSTIAIFSVFLMSFKQNIVFIEPDLARVNHVLSQTYTGQDYK